MTGRHKPSANERGVSVDSATQPALCTPADITPLERAVEQPDVQRKAACTVTLVDRLVHRCEIFAIDSDGYRLKEA